MGITSLLGPLLSGALYSVEHALPFVADAVSYTLSVASLLFIRSEFQKKREAAPRLLRVEIQEGLLWLWHHALIRSLALLGGGAELFSAGYLLIVIVLAQHMHASSLTIGLVFTLGGIGGILGALIVPFIQKYLRFGQVIISGSWLVVLLTVLYVMAPNPIVLGVLVGLFFMIETIYNVVQFSYRLTLIPDAFQGRVNSVFRLIAFSGQPLGLALTGLLLEKIGVLPTVLISTTGLALLAVMATLNSPIRRVRPLAEVIAR